MIADWFLGSRKFLVMLGLLLLSAVFRITGLIASKDFADLLSDTGVAFMGANTVEHMFAAAKEWAMKKGASNDGQNPK